MSLSAHPRFCKDYTRFEKGWLMIKMRFAAPAAVTAFLLLCFPALVLADSARPGSVQTPRAVLPSAQPTMAPLPPNDFDGLSFTDEQKAEIDKIHRETESYKSLVAKDDKLTPDQKDAMLVGYTRLEYGRTFKVLTPEQQKEVRQKALARRAADQSAHQKQPPRH